jgi:hypothetical protein
LEETNPQKTSETENEIKIMAPLHEMKVSVFLLQQKMPQSNNNKISTQFQATSPGKLARFVGICAAHSTREWCLPNWALSIRLHYSIFPP